MPPAIATPTRFSALAAAAEANYRSLVCDVAQGAGVDEAEALRIALAANRSAIQLDADVRVATERFHAAEAHRLANYDVAIETAKAEYRAALDDATAAGAKSDAAQKAALAAHAKSQAALGAFNRTTQQKSDAAREFAELMGETGDASDWKKFDLC